MRRFSTARPLRQAAQASLAPARKMSMDELIKHCSNRGFIWPGSSLYGSIGTGFDYGPMGAQLKKNLQDLWWRDFITRRPECAGLDTALLTSPRVLEASGHVDMFVDPLTECQGCRKRVRVDKLLSAALAGTLEQPEAAGKKKSGKGATPAAPPPPPAEPSPLLQRVRAAPASLAGCSLEELGALVVEMGVCCPGCGASPVPGASGLQTPRMFNLLFETRVGPAMPGDPSRFDATATTAAATAGKKGVDPNPNQISHAYLRPETAQGVYSNYWNATRSWRTKLPLGLGQVGRSFRNEVAVSQFVFRSREFDQAELQYFVPPAEASTWFSYWVEACHRWLIEVVGLDPEAVRRHEYGTGELAHYALATTDLEFHYPFGWEEVWGVANRGDYDLRQHAAASKTKIPKGEELPFAIEPAMGVNRVLLALLCDKMVVEKDEASGGDGRAVFRVPEALAPTSVAVLPIVKAEGLVAVAKGLLDGLVEADVRTTYSDTASVGRRYARQDEVGTPFAITVDDASLGVGGTVSLRHRDNKKQIRLHLQEVLDLAATRRLSMKHLDARFEAEGVLPAPKAAAGGEE